uniref:Uncharacterized protein n=1 Tax=Meloidogyne incognita TaxID=6306 RepID=A0A914MEJ7_MELIC
MSPSIHLKVPLCEEGRKSFQSDHESQDWPDCGSPHQLLAQPKTPLHRSIQIPKEPRTHTFTPTLSSIKMDAERFCIKIPTKLEMLQPKIGQN